MELANFFSNYFESYSAISSVICLKFATKRLSTNPLKIASIITLEIRLTFSSGVYLYFILFYRQTTRSLFWSSFDIFLVFLFRYFVTSSLDICFFLGIASVIPLVIYLTTILVIPSAFYSELLSEFFVCWISLIMLYGIPSVIRLKTSPVCLLLISSIISTQILWTIFPINV